MGNRADCDVARRARGISRLADRLAGLCEGLLAPLPPDLRRPLRWLLWLPVDLVDGLAGRRPPTVPPRGLRDVGAGDFAAVGDELARHLLEHCRLEPDSRVLDVARALRPGGRCLATFFLQSEESRALGEQGLGGHRFPSRVGDAWVADEEQPEAAVAYDEELLRAFCARVGLEVVEPVLWGAWCGRERYTGYQDTVILERRSTSAGG